MKTVWITRTETQTPNRVPKGWRVLNIPLLRVAPAPDVPNPPLSDDVLIFTSGNAVNCFCAFTDRRHWPVFTVGDTTAQVARNAGFKNIESAGKDVIALRELLVQKSALNSKRLYYASGRDVSGNLESDLRKDGYVIERSILYETSVIDKVPADICQEFENGSSVVVLLYSVKGAQAFGALNLNFAKLETVSISANVDAHLTKLDLKRRRIAENPTHQALIKQLD